MSFLSFWIAFQLHWFAGDFPKINQAWHLGGDRVMAVGHLSMGRDHCIIDNSGKILIKLGSDEVVDHSILNQDGNRLFIKIDREKAYQNGVTVRWYSRTAWVMNGKRGSLAYSILPYDCDFLQKAGISIKKLISVSDDGATIKVGIKIVKNGESVDETLVIDPFKPSFVK